MHFIIGFAILCIILAIPETRKIALILGGIIFVIGFLLLLASLHS